MSAAVINQNPNLSSQTKIRFDTNKESSSESLSGETVKKKSPPQPLPKPRWYLEQRAKGIAMPVSPEKVKITENMLPSPQRLIGTVEKSPASSSTIQMPEKTLGMISRKNSQITNFWSQAEIQKFHQKILNF